MNLSGFKIKYTRKSDGKTFLAKPGGTRETGIKKLYSVKDDSFIVVTKFELHTEFISHGDDRMRKRYNLGDKFTPIGF